MLSTYFLLGFVVLVFYTCLLNTRRQKYPPGPIRLPFIGSAWAIGTNSFRIHVSLTDLAKKWGPIYQLHFVNQPVVVITSPHLIREGFDGMQSALVPRFVSVTLWKLTNGESILSSEDRYKWAVLRKMATPLLKNFPGGTPIIHVIEKEVAKLIAHMENHVATGVHLIPWFMFFTRNVFLEIAIRKSWSYNTKDKEEQEFNESMVRLMDNLNSMVDFIPELDFLAKKSRSIAYKHSMNIKNFVLKIIESRESDSITEETARDFMDVLLCEKKKHPEISNDTLALNIRDIMFAASLTVSDTLDWLIMYLCDHPDIQEKCYKEIYGKLKGRMPHMEDKTDLPYLDNTLKEVLRLRPPAPVSLPHLADRDCVIGGYHIKKGTVVIENVYGIGNWDKFFANPAQFDPDRWTRNPELSSNLLTFGYGPTICLGMPIAKQELFLGAAALLQKFKFRFMPGTEIDFTGEFKTTFNAKPWKVMYYVRKDDSTRLD